jgi:ABC-type lipoprotein release transport system permease subunit
MDEWYLEPVFMITVAIALVVIILMIWLSVLGSRLKKLRKQYVAVMGNTGVTNIEDVVLEMKSMLQSQKEQINSLQNQLNAVQIEMPKMKSKLGIIRYNAFSDGGSDLSFSLAVVNEEKDGAVFSGLHSRDNTYVYAKPLEKGESAYTLTPEEKKAIESAK